MIGGVERAEVIDPRDAFQCLEVGVSEIRPHGLSGGADEDVQPAKAAYGLLDRPAALLGVRDICWYTQRLPTPGGYFVDHFLECCPVASGHDNARAVGRQAQSRRSADARGAPRDEHHLVRERMHE